MRKAGRPQRSTSLGDGALAKIRKALVDGTLAPGQRIREMELAERFSMSRTPIREAIHMLRVKGLVTYKDGALVITRLDRRLLDEIYAMRETLEGMAARLTAINAKPRDVEDLNILLSNEASASSPQERAQINKQFHSLLAVLADNRYLSQAIEDLSETLTLLGPTTLANESRFAAAHGEHAAIVEAIAAGDAELAENRIRAHLQGAWKTRRTMILDEAGNNLGLAGSPLGGGTGRRA